MIYYYNNSLLNHNTAPVDDEFWNWIDDKPSPYLNHTPQSCLSQCKCTKKKI